MVSVGLQGLALSSALPQTCGVYLTQQPLSHREISFLPPIGRFHTGTEKYNKAGGRRVPRDGDCPSSPLWQCAAVLCLQT